MGTRAIVWFRGDLRLHDNEAILEGLNHTDELIYTYIFDERVFDGQTKYGFRKTGKYRAKFLIESIHDLRSSLEKKGAQLIVRVGKPEEILFEMCRDTQSSWIFCNRERTSEEEYVQDELEKKIWSIGREVRFSRGKMLYYTADLPFPITQTPETFTTFRKEVEKIIPIRPPLETDQMHLKPAKISLEDGIIPDLRDFGFSNKERKFKTLFEGGESKALAELNYYLWETDLISKYKTTRNGLLGRDYSSKLSPYLAAGCLSPKKIAAEIFKYEKERRKNDSTYWLLFELLWRDFFRLMGKKHGNAIFQVGGMKQNDAVSRKIDWELFEKWASGNTGVPFIDANMRELNETGFMSNRGRQNVASFLINDLNLNWLLGAEYFESLLVDYDPCSNYGNWNYLAGVGNDPRSDRYFNIMHQAKRYDPEGNFVRRWVPELVGIPGDKIHDPSLLDEDQQIEFGLDSSSIYKNAVIELSRWN